MRGGPGNDVILGLGGGDQAFGGGGDDSIDGGGNSDWVEGEAGNDTLLGGLGDDWLTGGAGADVFAFRAGDGADRIVDFTRGTDRLHFLNETAAQVTWRAAESSGYSGTLLTHEGGTIFLHNIVSLSSADMTFG